MKRNPQFRSVSNEKIIEIYNFYQENNYSVVKVAEIYGLNERTLRSYFIKLKQGKLNIQRKIGIQKNKEFKENINDVFKQLINGETLKKILISKGLNYHQYYMQVIKYNGYPIENELTTQRNYHKLLKLRILEEMNKS